MSFIYNKNHNRTHVPGCTAVSMMNREKNEVQVEEPQGHICKWCGASLGHNQTTLDSDRILGVEICTDPYIRNIFKKSGCLNGCGNLGDIKMFPDKEAGVEVDGRTGKWWVYLECYECGYQSALWKAVHKLEVEAQAAKERHEPVRVI